MNQVANTEISIAGWLDAAVSKLADSSASPRLDAEVLLAHALGRPRSYLRARPEIAVNAERAGAFADLITRRAEGAPVAYLTGMREFFSLPLMVDASVLIPRPETELLVELALERIPAHAARCVLDAGTGSGAIALAIARERPGCRVIASDISTGALTVAACNAGRLGLCNVEFVEGDWLAPFHAQSFDLIVSNPPYVPDADPHLEQGDVRAEPRDALAAGSDGLDAIRTLVRSAPCKLRPRGWLILEHGYDQREAVAEILRSGTFTSVESVRDLGGRPRAACARAG